MIIWKQLEYTPSCMHKFFYNEMVTLQTLVLFFHEYIVLLRMKNILVKRHFWSAIEVKF